MTRIRKIRWIGWTLPIIAGAIVYADLASGHIAKSMFWTLFALILGAIGLALYIWASTTPGEPVFLFSSHKHTRAKTVLFFGTMAALTVALIRMTLFDPQRSGWRDLRSAVFSIVLIVTYWPLIALIRYLRSRGRNSANIQKQTEISR